MSSPSSVEVAVVGGGPAGLAAALAAARQGLQVTVLERFGPPVDKACGEGLMPDAVAALRRLGVEPEETGGRPFDAIRYLDDRVEARGTLPGGPGLGLRRTRLHEIMTREALASGIDIRWRTRVEGLLEDGLATGGGRLQARWIVGADGLHSQVRRWAGLAAGPGRHHRYGVRRHYRVAPWSREVEVHWSDEAEAYVTPVASDEVSVALLWRGAAAGFDGLLGRFPRLAERLSAAACSSRDRGAGPFHQRVRGVLRGRVALLGDASGYLDPITGEGLGIAFRQAIALGKALQGGDLHSYAAAHRRLVRGPTRLTALLLQVERRPWLRRRFIGALAADPDLFSRLLGDLASGNDPLAPGSPLPWRLARGMVMRPEMQLRP